MGKAKNKEKRGIMVEILCLDLTIKHFFQRVALKVDQALAISLIWVSYQLDLPELESWVFKRREQRNRQLQKEAEKLVERWAREEEDPELTALADAGRHQKLVQEFHRRTN